MKPIISSITLSTMALAMMSSALAAAELRFTVWTGNDAHLALLNGMADSFKETHPDVSVRFETIPAGDYTQKLTFQLAGGNPPDAGWMMEDAAPTFAGAGVLEDLSPTLKSDEGYDLPDFSEPAMGLWSGDGKVWGVPFSTSPFVIFYNKDLFDQAGLEDPYTLAAKGEWDMGKFQEVAKALADGTGKWGFEFKDGQGYETRIMHALMPPIRAYGGDVWTNQECGFDKPEAVAAVQQLHDMVFDDKSIVPPGENGDFFTGSSA
ncbi:MAG TPA: extracellular solute-binding protein, partial [Pseudorhizobium sp.]|nr:extracellular solute-binding protein [Pseudorhizobium sp.]